jgi:O-antigen/teichoic acid export membrane protein
MDLSGTGRHFVWTNLPGLVSMITSTFLLAFSIRKIGAGEYGAVVTIGSMVSILALFALAVRYAVVRSTARSGDPTQIDNASHQADRDAIEASNSLFGIFAAGMVILAVAFGWLVPADLHFHGEMWVQTYVATILFVTAAAVGVFFMAYAGVLVGKEKYKYTAEITICGLLFQVALSLLLVGRFHIVGLGLAALGSGIVQGVAIFVYGHKYVPWLPLLPSRTDRSSLSPVLRYAAGIAILSATATICAASDAFVIGAIKGALAVTIFKVGSVAPVSLVALLYSAFAVVFPRLARSQSPKEQEEAVGWIGKVTGWVTGWLFASLCLLSMDIVRLLLGRSNEQAGEIIWICAAALTVDVSYHGFVQVIYARGEQGFLAKYSWIELVFNLGATCLFVDLFGPVGSAWALAGTILVTDVIGVPIIMRGRWGSAAGRFVFSHGVLQSILAGALTLGIGIYPVLLTRGLEMHVLVMAVAAVIVLGIGAALAGRSGRSRLRGLLKSNKLVTSLDSI